MPRGHLDVSDATASVDSDRSVCSISERQPAPINITELYRKFVTYYGLSSPWTLQKQERLQQQRQKMTERPRSRRGRRPYRRSENDLPPVAPLQPAAAELQQQTRRRQPVEKLNPPMITLMSEICSNDVNLPSIRSKFGRADGNTDASDEAAQKDLKVVRGRHASPEDELTTRDFMSIDAMPIGTRTYRYRSDDATPPTTNMFASSLLTWSDVRLDRSTDGTMARAINFANHRQAGVSTRHDAEAFRQEQNGYVRSHRRRPLHTFNDSSVVYDHSTYRMMRKDYFVDPPSLTDNGRHRWSDGLRGAPCKQDFSGGTQNKTSNFRDAVQPAPAAASVDFRSPHFNGNHSVSKLQHQTSDEPTYSDPTMNASVTFCQRLNELDVLEVRTIRWEKTRKLKKKRSRDSL